MNFYGSIAAGICTIWERFEPDAAQSPDPGSGRVFKIARRIACESRKTAFNFGSDTDHIRDAVGLSVSGLYSDY